MQLMNCSPLILTALALASGCAAKRGATGHTSGATPASDAPIASSSPSESLPSADTSAVNTSDSPTLEPTPECVTDTDCGEGKFCDRGTCALPGDFSYGNVCSSPLIGPIGTAAGKTNLCGNFLCLDGRCRSCLSNEECFHEAGYFACYADGVRPAPRCASGGDVPSEVELYVPERVPVQAGVRVENVEQGDCVDDRVDLEIGGDVSLTGNMHLVLVWWHQRNGEPDPFMQIGYDAPVTSAQVSVRYTDVTLPYEENMICDRLCRDPALCDCADDFQVALGTLTLIEDGDGDGGISTDELIGEQVGGTTTAIGWAKKQLSDPPEQMLRLVDFDQVVSAGFCTYQMSEYQDIERFDTGETPSDMGTCPIGDAACAFPHFEVLSFVHYVDPERSWGLNRHGF